MSDIRTYMGFERFVTEINEAVVSKAPFGIRVKGLTDEEIVYFSNMLTDIVTNAIEEAKEISD